MTRKIVLVGCGNVGSRHLQALLKLPYQTRIDIVEPEEKSRELAKKRLHEIRFNKIIHHLNWFESIENIEHSSDLAILATTSFKRIELIEKLLKFDHSRFLIEKIVCQSKTEYNRLLELFNKYKAKGWVNTPRRYFNSYQEIKNRFQNSKRIHLSVLAGDIGLGTNAIHYIDLFSWLCNDYKIKLNGDFLYDRILKNKRGKNFVEFAGTIIGSSSNGSTLSVHFLPYDNLSITVDVISERNNLLINETNQKLYVVEGNKSNKKIKFREEYVSNITNQIAHQIFRKDNCILPTIHDSWYAHLELFRIFDNHIKKLTGKKPRLCPIT